MESVKAKVRRFLGLDKDKELLLNAIQNLNLTIRRDQDLWKSVLDALERGQKTFDPHDPAVRAESDRLTATHTSRLIAEYKARKHTEDGSY